MIIYAVYVITEGGELMYSENFHGKSMKDLDLVSGLLTALRMFAKEVTHADVKAFEVEGLTYHFQSFNIFYVVLVTSSLEEPQKYLHQLGLRFMKKFGGDFLTNRENPIDYAFFNSFKGDVDEVLGSIVDVSSSINPTKKLTTAEIFNLPIDTQKVALAILQIEQGSLEDISNEVNLDDSNTKILLDKLISIGYIGQKTSNGKIIYFCTF
ncbi:MAG: hypothetical protein EU530_10470 [Promethearchaeota archaeon]|nr:MAG: hypothetical protein EU530_10470 [Candidatus Lokiarchaeota archaeon]